MDVKYCENMAKALICLRVGSSECGKELSCPVKGKEFVFVDKERWLFKKNSALSN
jgi:hypothetical protein